MQRAKKKKRKHLQPRLNHWSHIDYTSDVFTIFLELESGNYIALNGGTDYGSICVAKFNLQCNMQNGNAICKMAMYFCI